MSGITLNTPEGRRKTKAEVAQEIFDANERALDSHREAVARGDGKSYGIGFYHSDDREVMAIVEDLQFEKRERERQKAARREYWRMMSILVFNDDKSFGMQELVEK